MHMSPEREEGVVTSNVPCGLETVLSPNHTFIHPSHSSAAAGHFQCSVRVPLSRRGLTCPSTPSSYCHGGDLLVHPPPPPTVTEEACLSILSLQLLSRRWLACSPLQPLSRRVLTCPSAPLPTPATVTSRRRLACPSAHPSSLLIFRELPI